MSIFPYSEMNERAGNQLQRVPQARTVLLIYTGVALGMSVVAVVISAVLSLQISHSGGLGNLGTRSTLSTIQSMLPIVQALVMMGLEVGYLNAMLRVARGQYTSPNSLRLGFDRFWVLLRMNIIQALIFSGVGFASVYAAVLIYILSPFSQGVQELLLPLINETTILSSAPVLDDAMYGQLIHSMLPAFGLCLVLFGLLAIPLAYRYRMANYVIIDKPGIGAIAALRESRQMMRGNRMALARLDLHLWPYYLGVLAATVLSYGDLILNILNISVPISGDVLYYLCYALYIGALFALYYFLRNRLEVVYALAYEQVKPQPPQENGVVLGSIFQM